MEQGFILPDGEYLQTLSGGNSVEQYPPGTVEVPLRPSSDHHWEDGQWVRQAPSPPELTNGDVNAERDRRILEGHTFTTSAGPIAVAGDEITTRNLQALAVLAQMRISSGEASTITQYRDETDTIHDLTQAQVIELWSYSVAFVEANFQASWAIKDDPDGIPENFTDDTYWP